ncbi:hypothetical protein JD844_016626 [Phrynosoma platyrhinos]|uniref:Mitochondrial calcium uniporter regulator 1 n=1 Tax=Phrynosoma platyrhinos TaxID=52577 RepID=A0ABQ7SKV8_PHRPL|nr:hypothetical protein JD844_016626 [Phrynosoma platyrhinos]
MARGQVGAVVLVLSGRRALSLVRRETDLLLPFPTDAGRRGVTLFRVPRRCLGDWKRAGCLETRPGGASSGGARARCCALAVARPRFLSQNVALCRAAEERDVAISASPAQSETTKGSFSLSGSRRLYFDTHALVCLLEANGFTTQQSEVIVSALMNIMKSNTDVIYKDMVTKVQQEIALQQIMSHIGVVKKDMIILEKSEFSALRAENEKIRLELQQLKKQVTDETSKVRTDSKLDFNLEKSRVKELYSLNERKLLKMRTEIVELLHRKRAYRLPPREEQEEEGFTSAVSKLPVAEVREESFICHRAQAGPDNEDAAYASAAKPFQLKLLVGEVQDLDLEHAHQDRALTQTDRKIDTEVAGLKTMLESHKLDNIKYLAGSVFTCLTVALGFYRLWV